MDACKEMKALKNYLILISKFYKKFLKASNFDKQSLGLRGKKVEHYHLHYEFENGKIDIDFELRIANLLSSKLFKIYDEILNPEKKVFHNMNKSKETSSKKGIEDDLKKNGTRNLELFV